MRHLVFALILAALPVAAEAQATGVVVGKECLASWTAPTVDGSGNPLIGNLAPTQANVYVTTTATSPTQGSGQAAILTPVSGVIPASWGCANVTPGQHWIWVSYSNVNGEGTLANAPFVLSTAIPGAPSGMAVR